jgi:hypothetical protein
MSEADCDGCGLTWDGTLTASCCVGTRMRMLQRDKAEYIAASDAACKLLSERFKELEAQLAAGRFVNDAIAAENEVVKLHLFAVEAQRDALAVALDDLLGCPFTVDAASVPACGIEAAPPYQVVSVMSVAWTRIQNAHQALAAVEAKEGE